MERLAVVGEGGRTLLDVRNPVGDSCFTATLLLQDRMGDDIHDEAFLRPKRLWYCSSTTFQEGLRSIRSIYKTDAHQNRLTTPQHSTYTLSLSG